MKTGRVKMNMWRSHEAPLLIFQLLLCKVINLEEVYQIPWLSLCSVMGRWGRGCHPTHQKRTKPGWMQHHQDLNLQSPDNKANASLPHSGVASKLNGRPVKGKSKGESESVSLCVESELSSEAVKGNFNSCWVSYRLIQEEGNSKSCQANQFGVDSKSASVTGHKVWFSSFLCSLTTENVTTYAFWNTSL